ncbi:MAG: extracellular solute-binding protein [Clostridia bacterium]|nr:extracellular solute-binding protein [Clostridia bacterium]
MKKRLISLAVLLSFAMSMTSVITACNGTEPSVDDTTPSGGDVTSTPATETDSKFEPDDLPANLNFDGETINVLYRDDVVKSFYVEEQTGDIVDDAVYNANRAVEDRLNIKFNVTTKAGTANADRSTYMNAITTSVMAGDNAYDLTAVMTFNMPTLIQQGVFIDLNEVQYLNFDKPWWVQDLTDLASINGKLYFASGDITLELTQRIFCMLFNKNLAETLGTEDIYALVKDGKWTLDKATELAVAAYADLNGDSKMDPEDRYGLVITDYNHISGFEGSLGLQETTQDADGIHHIDFGGERVITAFQKLVSMISDNDGIYYQIKSDADSNETHQIYYNMFKGGRLLITTTEFHQISSVYRDMNDDYGVIPYPMLDEEQGGYYTLARNVYSSFTIPKTCEKLDAVGAAMEALASENYRTTSQTYFETALKVKYSYDDETSQMYDIIKGGLTFNFGFTFNAVTNYFSSLIVNTLVKKEANWASVYASNKDAAENSLQKFYSDVMALED